MKMIPRFFNVFDRGVQCKVTSSSNLIGDIMSKISNNLSIYNNINKFNPRTEVDMFCKLNLYPLLYIITYS